MVLNQSYRQFLQEYQGKTSTEPLSAHRHLLRIQAIADHVSDLCGACVLDLGCGAKRANLSDQFEPWYCRLLHAAGADVLGIDIADNQSETFPVLRRDLSESGSLDDVETAKFDAVNNDAFVIPRETAYATAAHTAPEIQQVILARRSWKEILLQSGQAQLIECVHAKVRELNVRIHADVRRLLKEGGVYTHAEHVYKKREGQLVLQPEILL